MMAKKSLLLLAVTLMSNLMLLVQSKTLPLDKRLLSHQKNHISYLPCPNGWVSYEGSPSCYKVSSQPTNSWYEARKACLSMRGDLVKISSAQENNYVAMLAHTYFPTLPHSWIGMIAEELKDKKQGKFHWVDGTAAAGQYLNWHKGEPSNYLNKEFCGAILATNKHGMKWNDIACVTTTKESYVCEKERLC